MFKNCYCTFLRCVRVAYIIPMVPEVIFVVIFFLRWISWPLWFWFFSLAYGCTTLLFTFTLVVWVYAATLRAHNSAWSDQIWSSFWLNWVDILPFFVVITVNASSRAAVAEEKSMKTSSILTCFTLLALPYPTAPAVYFSSFLSRYDSWKLSWKRTHVRSLAVITFHTWYTCLFLCRKYSGDTHVFQLLIRDWEITRYCELLTCLHLDEQDFYRVFDVIRCLHFALITN